MACKRSAVRSRVAPPLFKMNGRQNHSFSTEFGVIAQLGERLHGMQEVRGSIPRSSTIFRKESRKGHRIAVAFLFLRYLVSRISPIAWVKPLIWTKKPATLAGFACTIQTRRG